MAKSKQSKKTLTLADLADVKLANSPENDIKSNEHQDEPQESQVKKLDPKILALIEQSSRHDVNFDYVRYFLKEPYMIHQKRVFENKQFKELLFIFGKKSNDGRFEEYFKITDMKQFLRYLLENTEYIQERFFEDDLEAILDELEGYKLNRRFMKACKGIYKSGSSYSTPMGVGSKWD